MRHTLAYLDEARNDINETRGWYKKQQKGLSKRFSASVKDAIIRIQLQPDVFAQRYHNVRIVHTVTFPYSVYYTILPTQIVIIAVVHNHRNPHSILDRIDP